VAGANGLPGAFTPELAAGTASKVYEKLLLGSVIGHVTPDTYWVETHDVAGAVPFGAPLEIAITGPARLDGTSNEVTVLLSAVEE
jgi:hypothetical protein